jgi:hypothetical protein
MQIFSYYISLNSFMLITRWHLHKKLKTTLPTHPQKNSFQLISLWTLVNSRETLPLRLEGAFLKSSTSCNVYYKHAAIRIVFVGVYVRVLCHVPVPDCLSVSVFLSLACLGPCPSKNISMASVAACLWSLFTGQPLTRTDQSNVILQLYDEAILLFLLRLS